MEIYGEVRVMMYGSSVNGLAVKGSSDLDLTLIVMSGKEANHLALLSQVHGILQKQRRIGSLLMLPLKRLQLLKFEDLTHHIKVDVTVNGVCQVFNSNLLCTYARIDTRFVDCAMILKYWNSKLFTNDMMKLNSYSLVLMLIAFLQHKGILPNIQSIGEQKEVIMKQDI
jgi:DNA polymerase sigma